MPVKSLFVEQRSSVFASGDRCAAVPSTINNTRPHEESNEGAGVASHKWFAMVHTPVSLSDAARIPSASKALDKEWNKLQNELKAWDLGTVAERDDVIKRCKQRGKTAHFGTLMTLCHEKHSELNRPPEQREYKGRVVLRGDTVRDDTGYYAVSASKALQRRTWRQQNSLTR